MTTKKEVWRDIPGYEGHYQVSDQGRVRSVDRVVPGRYGDTKLRGKVLSQVVGSSGRKGVSLSRGGVIVRKETHRLMAKAFLGPIPKGFHVCHNDGDCLNNSLDNLRIDTPKSNHADRLIHGTSARHLVESGRHNMASKKACPRGHDLKSPNLVPSSLRKGRRDCLSCSRASSYTRRNGGDFKEISDNYYRFIME